MREERTDSRRQHIFPIPFHGELEEVDTKRRPKNANLGRLGVKEEERDGTQGLRTPRPIGVATLVT